MESAYWNIQVHLAMAMHCGGGLYTLRINMTNYAKMAAQCKQLEVCTYIGINTEAVNELIGDEDEESVHKAFPKGGNDSLYEHLESQKLDRACWVICNNHKFVSVYKGDIDDAVKYYHLSLKHPIKVHFMTSLCGLFFDGLIAFACAERQDEDKEQWVSIGTKVIDKMKLWAENSHWNFSNKLYLLEARQYALNGADTLAVERYETSIKASNSHRFIHEEGLANQMAGDYHLRKGRVDSAMMHFGQAKECYERWGACALADQMHEKSGDMICTTALASLTRLNPSSTMPTSASKRQNSSLYTWKR